MYLLKKIKEKVRSRVMWKKFRQCMVAALVDSYYYRSEIYVLKSGNDFVHVRKRHLKVEKRNRPKSFNGKGIREVMDGAIATVAAGAVLDCRVDCQCEDYEMAAAFKVGKLAGSVKKRQ